MSTTTESTTRYDRDEMTTLFADEVVTSSHVQLVPLADGGSLALLTLDNGHDHTKPTTFGPAGLFGIGDALDSLTDGIASGDVRGAGVVARASRGGGGAELARSIWPRG